MTELPIPRPSWERHGNVSDPQLTAAAALCLGAAAHQVLRRYEVDSTLPEMLQGLAAASGLLALAGWHLGPLGDDGDGGGGNVFGAVRFALWVDAFLLVGLFSSIVVYRAFFHRLGRFPGPGPARVTRLWALWRAAEKVQFNETVRGLHREYGDFVRIGPRELSINRPSAIRALHGPPSSLRKSPWYNQLIRDPDKSSLVGCRDVEAHRRRRRAWDRALGAKALASYSGPVVSKADALVSQLANRQGEAVDFTKWAFYYAFDVMGVVGLGKDFAMMDTGRAHEAMSALHDQMTMTGVLGTMPWLMYLITRLPIDGGFGVFTKFCVDQLNIKIEATKPGQKPQDILSWILLANYEGDQSARLGRSALEQDSRLLIIAGSDTSAAVITNAIFFLAKNQRELKKLQGFLDEAFPNGQRDWTFQEAKQIPYLTYVANETMRIKAPIPSGLYRLTPPEGLVVDGVHIPGDVVVSVPTHTIQLDPRNFADPEEFIPERWEDVSSADDVPFLPFSRGPYACAGKQLAMMEILTVVSKMALAFDFTFAREGDDGSQFDKGYEDTFVLTLPELSLRFKARK